MIQQVLAIARNAFVESIRQPIFTVVTLAGVLVFVLLPSIAANTLEDDNKLMVDMGLSTLALAGLFLAAFTATGVVSNEIENQTVLTTISKPVSRPAFVLGKFLGVAAALVLAFWTLTMVFMLAVRHKVMMTASDPFDLPVIVLGVGLGGVALFGSVAANYLHRKVFTSTLIVSLAVSQTAAFALVLFIAKGWKFQWPSAEMAREGAFMAGQLPMALLLVLQAVLLLTAVAIAASTRLGQVMTLVICALVFLLGLVSHGIFGAYVHDSTLAATLYYLIPNVHFLWTADALTNELDLTLEYVALASGYALLFIAAILFMAVGLFQTREVG